MATKYIDKFSFAKYLDSRYCRKCMAKDRTVNAPFLCHSCTINDMFHDLETYHTEDVVERKRGKWTEIRQGIGTRGRCSECMSYNWITPYCPNCGAQMGEDIPMEYFESGGK